MSAPGSPLSPGPGDAATSVLIVEDDAGIAAQLVRALTRGGYQVEHVATGGDALKMADLAARRGDLERALTTAEEAWLELSEEAEDS